MRNTFLVSFFSLSILSLGLGCGDDTTSTGGSSSGGNGTGASNNGGNGGNGTGASSTGGNGTGGTAMGGNGTGGTATGGNGTGGAGTGGMGTGGGGVTGDHLVISEVSVGPDAGEFVEIWNPTAAAIDLTDVYLSDNSTYVDIASGGAWMPITNNMGTDFLARFPAGTSIPADGVIVIGFNDTYFTQFNSCPDFYMGAAPLACNNTMVPVMLPGSMGSLVDAANLSNAREMLMLFTWSGNTNQTLKDIDYVTWGDMFEAGSRADKTGVAGYQPDTAPASQKAAPAPMPGSSVERCAVDSSETLTGGNGISGHDETSEDLGVSFVVQAAPTPGTKNACL